MHHGETRNGSTTLVCASAAMRHTVDLAKRAGESDAKVLLTGESGVGKDVLARKTHECSNRRNRPYIAVNCAGFPETLLESELFGHARGSFTGADRDRVGKIQMADGGTLFLDEVGEMSLRMQAALLRFLENGEIQTIGEKAHHVDVRLIAATNRNLGERVASGDFREDLLYRLRVIEIKVPALRDRREDIPALTDYFLQRAPRQLSISPEAQEALIRHRWPGNVRELQNVIEQAIWLARGSTITLEDLPEAIRNPMPRATAQHERRRQVSDQLFEALVAGQYSFWDHIHPLFLDRDITRHDIRELVKQGSPRHQGELSSSAAALRHARQRLSPFPQFPDGARVQG